MAALLIFVFMVAQTALGSGISLRLGPTSYSNGGSNPVSPSVSQLDLAYRTNSNWETSLSSLGLSLLKFDQAKGGAMIGLGFGWTVLGPGLVAAFGADFGCIGKSFCWNFDYRQAVAYGDGQVRYPFAIRLGGVYLF